jgi:acetyl esterase/lipase
MLAPHEGEPFAKWLNSLGVNAFVLKYRLYTSGYTLPTIFKDAQRAVRQVRSHAAEWNLDPARIGVIGSSAGGHLVSVLSTQFDKGQADSADPIERISCRPDFTIVCYGFINFDTKTMTNPKSREKALGANATDEQGFFFAPARNIKADGPPFFIWQTVEDQSVTVDNALNLADALRKEKVLFDLHLYEKGKHGIGLGNKVFDPEKVHPWTRACADWMQQHGFLSEKK